MKPLQKKNCRTLRKNYNSNRHEVLSWYKKDCIRSAERNGRTLQNKCADIE